MPENGLTPTSAKTKPAKNQASEKGPPPQGCPWEDAPALRHRGEPVRRPRRRHQHHAPHPAGRRRRGHPPGPQPLGGRGGERGGAGGRPCHRRQLVPGRPRRIFPLHDRPAPRARSPGHQGLRRRRRGHRAGRDRGAARLWRRPHLLPGGRPDPGPEGPHRRHDGARRRPPTDGGAGHPGRAFRRRPRRSGAHHHGLGDRWSGGPASGRPQRPGRGGRAGPGGGHYRHRRRRQIVAHRRAGAPLSGPQWRAEDRRAGHRSDAPQDRRRTARRPYPHERHRRAGHLRPFPGDPRRRDRGAGGAARGHNRLQGGRVPVDHGGDPGHRPGRRRHRALHRHFALCDDAGIRRRQPARKDRHAGLRRRGRHQQAGPQGRARRAPGRAQAGAAQPPGLPGEPR